MAIAGFKHRIFNTAGELAAFAAASATTIYGIVYDDNGKYILFYA